MEMAADDAINDSQRPTPEPSDSAGEDHPEPVTVAQYSTEIQATFAANMLREAGIRCEMVGGASSGFKAESPGYVRLLVSARDATRARMLLEEFDAEKSSDSDED
jgi:hypothetical protein